MSDGPVSLNVDPKIVREIVEKQIVAAVTASFEGQLGITEAIVRTVLAVKVNSDGKVDHYGYSGAKSYLEWLCESAIRKSVEIAVTKWAATKQPQIEAAVVKCLTAETKTIAKTLVDALVKCASNSYTLSVGINTAK